MTSSTLPARPRWYPIAVGTLVLAVVILCAVALFGLGEDGGLPYGILGFLTGLFATVAAGLVAVTEIGRQDEARRLDAAALDDLEPLRAASAHAVFDKAAPHKAVFDKAAPDKASSDRAGSDKAVFDNAGSDKTVFDKAAPDKTGSARTATDRSATDRNGAWS